MVFELLHGLMKFWTCGPFELDGSSNTWICRISQIQLLQGMFACKADKFVVIIMMYPNLTLAISHRWVHTMPKTLRIFGVMAIRNMASASHALSTSFIFCAFLSYFCLDFVLPRSQLSRRHAIARESLLPPDVPADVRWDLWPALPIAPYERRRTILQEYIPGELWGLEQKLGLLYVHVPIRMTVLRLKDGGGLLVYGAVAPTPECISMLRQLEATHGKVRFLILPTVAVEHKTFAGPLARQLPEAEVWYAPGGCRSNFSSGFG